MRANPDAISPGASSCINDGRSSLPLARQGRKLSDRFELMQSCCPFFASRLKCSVCKGLAS